MFDLNSMFLVLSKATEFYLPKDKSMSDERFVHRWPKSASLPSGDRPSAKELEIGSEFVVPPNLIPPQCGLITPAMLTLIELDQQHIDTIVQTVPGGAMNVQDVYPLSPLQEGILFHRLLNRESDTYVLSTLFELQSREQLGAFIDALQKVIDRHDILRTAVLWEGLPRPVQVVHRRATLPVEELLLDEDSNPLDYIKERMRPVHQMLDLRSAPLARLLVVTNSRNRKCYGLLKTHHLICDHQSLRLVVEEAMTYLEGGEQRLPPPMAYRTYVAETLEQARAKGEEAFFRGKLGDVDEATAPFGLLDVHGGGSQIEEISIALEPFLAHQIRVQARRLGVSAARLFHAGWAVVVARTSGRDDVVFGTVVLTSRQRGVRALRMLGMSVNTLPLRLRLQNVTAVELIQQTNRELTELLNYGNAPLTLTQRCSSMTGMAPLFTTLLNYRHSVPDQKPEVENTTGIRVLARGEAWTNYPITLTVDDLGQGFVLTVKTDRRVGSQRMAEYVQTAMHSLVEALVHAPHTSALMLPVLPQSELHQVINLFNTSQAPYPQEKLIHELFEEQAVRTPNALAVIYEGQSLTYAELNSKANQLARHLRNKGVGPDRLVGICVQRGLELVVGLFGVLKAGGAYVPLDPDYPAERLAQILEDAKPSVLLIQHRLREGLPETAAEVISLDGEWNDIAKHATTELDPRALGLTAHHLAYVIYTSGSMGKPKGVMIEHRNVISLWQGLEHMYSETPCQRIAVNASFNFDASVKQFVQLLSGRTIVLVPQECRWDAPRFLSFIEAQRIDGIDCTPWQLKSWLSAGLLKRNGDALRTVLIGGEAIDAELWSTLAQCCSDTHFYNVYGPTESTVDTTSAHLRGDAMTPHIGRPMENRSVYVLDEHRQPVPVGVAGEMYIGGAGVARGYLNLPEMTTQRFLPNPFSAEPGARIYKTGDMGCWRADGTIVYLGRNDHQVKIRGFRIELGEIEAQLLRHQQVKEAVVIAREDVPGDKRLVAYVIPQDLPDAVAAPSAEVLRAHLKTVLPEYMVPSAFVMLEHMPLTSNGKLDRRALPMPELGAYVSWQYVAPQGEVEEALAGIWQDLLRIERIGRQDNFFELGGHSLLIVQMMERLRRVGLSAEVRCVFENPTVAGLAGALTNTAAGQFEAPPNLIPSNCDAITPQMLPLVELEPQQIERIVQSVPGGAANIQDIYPLAPLQEGILFHHLLNERGGDTYIVPIVLSVSSRQRLDELIAALQAVIDRHDILRTAVLWEQLPRPVQVVYRRVKLPVEELLLDRDRDSMEQIREWTTPERQRLEFHSAPLMRLRVADDKNGQWYALLQTHHITTDHVSLDIVISEAVAHLEGRAQTLPESAPYRNHVAQVLAYARTHDAEAFFSRKLGDVDEPTAPFGLLDVRADGSRVEEARYELHAEFARKIREQARRLGVSAANLFHAAWSLVVAHTSGRDDVVFGSVLLGRLQGSAGAQRILGMFINTLPLRLQLRGISVRELIEQTQRELVELVGHEQASLAVAQRCSGVTGAVPLFATLFNYRHSVPDPEAQWSAASGFRVLAVQERTNYPITLSVDDLGEGFTLTAQTDRRIDPQRITAYLHTATQSLVDALEQAPGTPALALSIMPTEERRQIIESFNATTAACPSDKLIHELFEEQARHAPDVVALVHGGVSLNYAELNGKADALARHLRSKGVGPNKLVGICVERGQEMVIGLLGILKAGGAYVPMDPTYPAERLQYMLEDAAPHLLLTQKDLRVILPATTADVIELDAGLSRVSGDLDESLPVSDSSLAASNLLYVIYTSGSTGRPKGVAMPHRSMVNLIEWHRQSLALNEGHRVLQFAALSFDVAFQEIFSTLCTGGTLVLLDEWVRRDARALMELLCSQSIERLFVPPLMLQSLAEYFNDTGAAPRTLKDVITAGEQLRIGPEIAKLFKSLNGCRLHNHYGPTEAHVVTALTLAGDPDEWPALPAIGQPISNTQIYILDERQQPVPIGVAGEIYIGGANLARGYLNRPELSAEKFIRNPFSADPQARLYKTGDLGQWRADGTIECLGRNDDQVKIRGYRIELGEIEAQLMRYAQVKEAAVVVREEASGDKRLVAYVTQRDQSDLSPEKLRTHLREALPEYMVPSAFVILDNLPLTQSGKLNRRALPVPEIGAYASLQYEAPQGEVEEAIAKIWQDLLGAERVGRQDNFFELGGHSILVLKVLFEVKKHLGCALKVTDVYRSPTILQLAARIREGALEDELIDLSREAVLEKEIVAKPQLRYAENKAVMLTGATGFVGRFLLAQLLQDTDASIYCLVRARSETQASLRLRSALEKWDLWCDEFERRVVAIPGDLRLPRLGIDETVYESLSRNIDSIYHCATSMNHLETYTMAKPANVEAVREILKLATRGRPKLINYISTLGIFAVSGGDKPYVVDEGSPIEELEHPHSSGYVASKWVAEKILMTAGERGIPCNIFRLGLVWADTQQGRFDELQSADRLLKSCLHSGCGIKNFRFPMVPTPVDYVARAAVFLANRHCTGLGIFHISSSSDQMIAGLFERCREIVGTPLELMSQYRWICEMKRLHQAGCSLPIVPLIEFAFSMDEESFHRHQRDRKSTANVHFDSTCTHRELERVGIVAPAFNDDLLSLCVERMLYADQELEDIAGSAVETVLAVSGARLGLEGLRGPGA